MDRIVVKMPDTLHEFMLALAVIQEFQMQLIVGVQRNQRDQDYTTTFRLNEKFKYFEPCLKVVNENTPEYDYSGWDDQTRGEFDCFLDFDFLKAKEIVSANKRHITEGFGILQGTFTGAIQYGVWPQRHPILGPLFLKKESKDLSVLVMSWDIEVNNKFVRYLKNNYPELTITIVEVESEDPEIISRCVANFDVVIGRSSVTTYIAASLDKVVIEIFNTNDEYYLYGNDTISNYKFTIGNPSAELIWSLWEDVWQNFQEHLLDKIIPMEFEREHADSK